MSVEFSFPSENNNAATIISLTQIDDGDRVDDIDHALRQRHWVKRQSAMALKTRDSSKKLFTADSERPHSTQPTHQINNMSTTTPSIHRQPRKRSAKTVHCLIKDFMFEPEHLEIEVGDSITWLLASKSDVASEHQIISRNFLPELCFEGPIMGGAFGSTKFTKTMTEPGQLTFYCDVVPEMRGKVIVRRPEERIKVEKECFKLPLTSSVKTSPQGSKQMCEVAEGAQLLVPPPLVGAQQESITKSLKVRASGNGVKLESSTKNTIPEPCCDIVAPLTDVSCSEVRGVHDDSGSMDKENHTYSDGGVAYDCLSPKPSSPNTHHSPRPPLRSQKKKKKKKKKEDKRTPHTAAAAVCKDNSYGNTAGDAQRRSEVWISSPQLTGPLHDTAQTLESRTQMTSHGLFQSPSSRDNTKNRPHLERRPQKERRTQERPHNTDTNITDNMVRANNYEKTINNVKGDDSNEKECEVLHKYPEAVCSRSARRAAKEINDNGEMTSPLYSTVGIEYGREKGGNDRGYTDDNVWCHLKSPRNPEKLSSTVTAGEEAAIADGDDDEIDNDSREKQSSNKINSNSPKSSTEVVCGLPPSTAAVSSGPASMSSCSQPASSHLILPNQAMLPSHYEHHCTGDKHITFGTFGEQQQTRTDPISGLPPSRFEHEVVSFLRLRWENAQFISTIESI